MRRRETFIPLGHLPVHLFRGRDRALHPRYAALASHYTFAPKFCLPARRPRIPAAL